MEKYYIYCNRNVAYHALIHNTILSQSLTNEDFRTETPGFLSKETIFITKEKFSEGIVNMGSTDIYYPVVLEVEDDKNDSCVPVFFVTKTKNGIAVADTQRKLGDYDTVENCIGAFVIGEIPIELLSGLGFTTNEDRLNFRKSSPDQWFPLDLYFEVSLAEHNSKVTKEELIEAAEIMDGILKSKDIAELKDKILKRNKEKAALFLMTEATENWNTGRIKSSVDATLISFLDAPSGKLLETVQTAITKLQKEGRDFTIEQFLANKDEVLLSETDSINSILFRTIMQHLYSIQNEEPIDMTQVASLRQKCFDAVNLSDSNKKIEAAFKIIDNFVYERTENDPDKAIASLEEFPVLQALMMFLDQQNELSFLRNACSKLGQNERRYAYMMYGAYHGMAEIDGSRKSNRLFEHRAAELVLQRNADNGLVSKLPDSSMLSFCKNEKDMKDTYGINVQFKYWYDCKTSLEVLLGKAPNNILEDIYKLTKGSMVTVNEVYGLDKPITITLTYGEKEQSYEITNKAQVKGTTSNIQKEINKILKKDNKFIAEVFKKYMMNEKNYQRFYRRHEEDIQELCRKCEHE